MRHYLLLILLLAVTALGHAATKTPVRPKPKAVLQTDTSSSVSQRQFDSVSLKNYSHQPEFQYKEDPAGLSVWTRFWRWFWQMIARLFRTGQTKDNPSPFLIVLFYILKYLLIALGLGALAILILKLAGINPLSLFKGKSQSISLPYSEFMEDINQIDFDKGIADAVSNHNYRFAVRLLYLRSLKQLSDANLIQWQIDKTNNTYINEIANPNQRAAFNNLTRQFEYIWYGEFLINGQLYSSISSSFHDFNKVIA